MKIEVYGNEKYKTSDWSGGRTTELYIYPEDGSYAKREFLIRVSSATVELEESQFTKLEGIKRKLMILKGNMKLVHKDKKEVEMNQYDVDSFMGDWDTTSYGKVVDFNLMVKDSMDSDLFFCQVEKSKGLFFNKEEREQKIIIYVIEGNGKINDHEVKNSNLIVINDYQGEDCYIENGGNQDLKLAVCRVIL